MVTTAGDLTDLNGRQSQPRVTTERATGGPADPNVQEEWSPSTSAEPPQVGRHATEVAQWHGEEKWAAATAGKKQQYVLPTLALGGNGGLS